MKKQRIERFTPWIAGIPLIVVTDNSTAFSSSSLMQAVERLVDDRPGSKPNRGAGE